MSPRPYDLGSRRQQIDEGRRRVLDASRSLLREATRYTAFTLDEVAKRADVARATVYYQFGSKTGLLEALCDDLAVAGQMSELARAFTMAEPSEALHAFVACFVRFWDVDRIVMRRLRALGALDPDVGAVIAGRDERRRQGLAVLVGRTAQGDGAFDPAERDRVAGMLYALTSFETFDALAGADRTPADVVPDLVALARAVLALLEPG
ncbi:MAG: TetR/AcrR family transcriptional regulator [Acidimicrobiales bacterium]